MTLLNVIVVVIVAFPAFSPVTVPFSVTGAIFFPLELNVTLFRFTPAFFNIDVKFFGYFGVILAVWVTLPVYNVFDDGTFIAFSALLTVLIVK